MSENLRNVSHLVQANDIVGSHSTDSNIIGPELQNKSTTSKSYLELAIN
jgi:hypothetical protein